MGYCVVSNPPASFMFKTKNLPGSCWTHTWPDDPFRFLSGCMITRRWCMIKRKKELVVSQPFRKQQIMCITPLSSPFAVLDSVEKIKAEFVFPSRFRLQNLSP